MDTTMDMTMDTTMITTASVHRVSGQRAGSDYGYLLGDDRSSSGTRARVEDLEGISSEIVLPGAEADARAARAELDALHEELARLRAAREADQAGARS